MTQNSEQEDTDGASWGGLDRRDAIKALGLGGLGALAMNTEQADAQLSLNDEPIQKFGDPSVWETDPSDDKLVFRHVPSGNVWELVDDGSTTGFGGGGGGSNVPDWTEDGNSPQTENGANNSKYTISTKRDIYKVFVTASDQATSNNDLSMIVDGDTGSNYDQIDYDGTTTTNASDTGPLLSMQSGATQHIIVTMVGNWGVDWRLQNNTYGRVAGAVFVSRNTNISSPLDSFTVQRGASTDWEIEVFGRDIA